MPEREIDTEVFDLETVELDDLLEQLSFELIGSNITDQINGTTMSSCTDFLGILIGKFNAILEDERIEEEDRTEVKYQMIDFCHDVIEHISDEYDLAVNMVSDDYDTAVNVSYTLYSFFVLERNEYIENFFIKYIEINKDSLASSIGCDEDKEDVTTLSYKKKNIPPVYAVLLSSIDEVISFISSSGIDSYEFLDTVYDGSVVISNMKDYFDDCTLNGDFVTSMINNTIGGYDTAYYTQLRNNIRVAFNK